MITLRRIVQMCALSALVLSPAVLFADEVVLPKEDVAASSPQATPALPSPVEGIDFGNLRMPEPMNRSCTASTTCSVVGGTPVMCTGVSTCTFTATWVQCDGTTTFCTCDPANVPTCTDPVGFCNCWSAAPTNSWGVCRQAYCT